MKRALILGAAVLLLAACNDDPTGPSAGGSAAAGVLSVGGDLSCAIVSGGAARCWGSNNIGQLGNGQGSIIETSPAPVVGNLRFRVIAAENTLSCGITTDGAAYCWGGGHAGLGGPALNCGNQVTQYPCSNVPVPVSGGLRFTSVDVGYDFACALTGEGAAYCWGAMGGSTPTAVSPTLRFTSISTSNGHVCGLVADGAAYCWGANDLGELGTGPGTPRFQATPVPVAGGLRFSQITTGARSSCGITGAGVAYCWGGNGSGALGDGTTTNHPAPVQVTVVPRVEAIAMLTEHTCAIVPGGTVQCWGNNRVGQLGDGTVTSRLTAAPVAGQNTFRSIGAGDEFTCGATTAGEVLCWGINSAGQLGNGTKVDSRTPVRTLAGLAAG